MYASYHEAIQGIAKNAYDYLGKNILLTVFGTAAVPLFFFVPIIVLFIDIPWLGPALFFLKATGIMNFMAWVVETIDRRLPWYVPFIHPLIFITTLSAVWRGYHLVTTEGGIEWKERKVK